MGLARANVPMRQRYVMTPSKMFEKYDADGLFDEMFMAPGVPRSHYAPVAEQLMQLDPPAFERRRRMADVSFRNQGITFTVYSDQRGVEKIFPFDLVPRIIPANEWDIIERGLVAAHHRAEPVLPGHLPRAAHPARRRSSRRS